MEITEEDIQVIEIKENDDGSADIVLEISEKFKEEFKAQMGLKRFSRKAFNKWAIEAIRDATEITE